MKKIFFMMAALICSLGFVGCSDDDDEKFDQAQLEGSWYMVRWQGYEHYDGEKESWDKSFEFNNPKEDEDALKINIRKTGENRYSITVFNHYNGQWHEYTPEETTLNGKEFVFDGETSKILTLTKSKLVIETKGTDEDGDYYGKQTFQKIN